MNIAKVFKKLMMVALEEVNLADAVVNSRPQPLRNYDQIYMKNADMVIQTKLIGPLLEDRTVVFVGDGDSMCLMFGIFAANGLIKRPRHMIIVDFDERILEHINTFASRHGFGELIETRKYNVGDPPPDDLVEGADWFYTNPPYGSKNLGQSGIIFIDRCIELSKTKNSSGCIILPYDYNHQWARSAMLNVQSYLAGCGYVVSDMIQQLHTYHLADNPTLASCMMLVDRTEIKPTRYKGISVPPNEMEKLYGSPRRIPRYINKDGTEDFKW